MERFILKVWGLWRPVEMLVGAVFVMGALLKAADVNQFVVQISFYGVLSNPISFSIAALGTLCIETALGTALVLGARLRGGTVAATLALLAVFTGLICYGWAYHGLKDCGCFGRAEMSPEVSIAKNILLAVLCAFAWAGSARSPRRAWSWRGRVACYGIPVVAACCVSAYAYDHLEAAPQKETLFSQFVFDADGVQYDLGHGEYFVPIYSMTCEHCMASVEQVNALAEEPGIPPIVALCYEEQAGDFEDFLAKTDPSFPLHSFGTSVRTFLSLEGEEPPRFYLIRDGQPLKFWDGPVPEAEEIIAALGNTG